jgi:hypothetical protein
MKVSKLLESSLDDIKAQLAKLSGEFIPQYKAWREALSMEDIARLTHMVKSQRAKKGTTKRIDDETVDIYKTLGLVNDKNQLNSEVRPFLRWLAKNPTRDRDFVDKRSDANDALARGHLKRDNDWTSPLQKKARRIVKNLTDAEKVIFEKVYNRFLRDKTRNLAPMWGQMKMTDLIAMEKLGIVDDDGNLTDTGEFVVNYYMAFKNDPDGLDRVGKEQRVGNYGTARKRRENRTTKFTKPRK